MTANDITDATDRVLHTVEQVAQILGVHPRTVHTYIKHGLKTVRLNGKNSIRVSSQAISDFINKDDE